MVLFAASEPHAPHPVLQVVRYSLAPSNIARSFRYEGVRRALSTDLAYVSICLSRGTPSFWWL